MSEENENESEDEDWTDGKNLNGAQRIEIVSQERKSCRVRNLPFKLRNEDVHYGNTHVFSSSDLPDVSISSFAYSTNGATEDYDWGPKSIFSLTKTILLLK